MSSYTETDISIISAFKSGGISFEMKVTSFSIKLVSEIGKFIIYRGNKLPDRELYFLNKVKNHVSKNFSDFSFDRSTIKYYHFTDDFKVRYKNCYEIDITKAYWFFAYKHKFITDEIFHEGNKVSKKTRLAALGNLAKCERIWNFDGKIYKFSHEKRSLTEGVFFFVAKQTSDLLNRIRLEIGRKYLFFWVDAIFVRTEKAKDLVCLELRNEGLNYEYKFLPQVEVDINKINVYDRFPAKIKKDGTSDDIRVFNFPNESTLEYITKLISIA